MTTRKQFIGGTAAFAALGPRAAFAHPNAEPLLRLGIVSDLHHTTVDNGTMAQNCHCIEPAFRYFEQRKADGVLVCGDLVDFGTVASLHEVGAIWDRVFPNGRRSDGQPVVKLMHYGDHEMSTFMQNVQFRKWALSVCRDPDELNHYILDYGPGKAWEESFHEKWAPIQVKTVKGYTFVLAHHPVHTPESKNGNRIPGLAEFLANLKIDPNKPFFYSQHRHFEVGDTGEVLAKYPNVIAFHGHNHASCVDELGLSQEAFTKVNVPSLNYCSMRYGHENSRQNNPALLLPPVDCAKSWQGLFATVYADRIVIERRDFLHGLPLGPDWVIPLPSPDGSLRREERAKRAVPPQFAPDARVAQFERMGKTRRGVPVPQVTVRFPVAHASGAAPRAFDYEVSAMAGDRPVKTKLVFSRGSYWADETDRSPVECAFAKSELPPDWRENVTFAVTPRDSFGNCGRTIRAPKGSYWYRGMLHMHSLWSDGRALPEQAVAAYRNAGYDFVALTDHNRFQDNPDRWLDIEDWTGKPWPPKTVHPDLVENYRREFGSGNFRTANGREQIRLATYKELKARFERPGQFLMLPGVEITCDALKPSGTKHSVHMNVIGIDDVIERAKNAPLIEKLEDHTAASAIRETRKLVDALARARHVSRHVFMVNHPQWINYDVMPQDLIDNPEVGFFEICNNGTESEIPESLGLDREYYVDNLWDAVLAHRVRNRRGLLYGFGSDDTHFYPGSGIAPGVFEDGYVMVRAKALTQEALMAAIFSGDFYAASGLDLEDVRFRAQTGELAVSVPPKDGVRYRIRFIVSKKDAPLRPVRTVEVPATAANHNRGRSVPIYDERIGMTAKLVEGRPGERVRAVYQLADDDLYVRARVESDEPSVYPHENWLHPNFRVAWTQPYCRK